ncbi:MAG: hypothetical protein AAB787_03180 [Patescibacteria group bacterium]
MAIIVEEEKKNGGGFLGLLTWVILIGVIGFAAYYIFFKKAEIVDVVIPANFENINQITAKRIEPKEIEENPIFKSLVTDPTYPTAAKVGRVNPFLPL